MLFQPATETWHALNPTATAIWRRLAGGDSLEQAAQALATSFGADPDQLLSDVDAFAGDAVRLGLLEPIGR